MNGTCSDSTKCFFLPFYCKKINSLSCSVYSRTCTWFNSWGCHHWRSEQTWGVMGYSCVNKHGMCAPGQSFFQEMSFWIAATVDDTFIPPATADHNYTLVHVRLEGSLSFRPWCRRLQRVVMCPKWVRQEAKPAAYQHLTKAISRGYDSDEEACFPPGELRQEKREPVKAIKEASIGSAALRAQRNRACFSSDRSPTLKSRPQLSWEQKNHSVQSFIYGFINLLKLIIGFTSSFVGKCRRMSKLPDRH